MLKVETISESSHSIICEFKNFMVTLKDEEEDKWIVFIKMTTSQNQKAHSKIYLSVKRGCSYIF